MNTQKLVALGLSIAAFVGAYFTRSDPGYALPLAAVGGQLVGWVFPELGKARS